MNNLRRLLVLILAVLVGDSPGEPIPTVTHNPINRLSVPTYLRERGDVAIASSETAA